MAAPNYRLPPLNALRAFETAARHLSFKNAARELHVTPGAVSHQVKVLEDSLGMPLFRRLTRALELTPEGQALLPKLQEGLRSLAEAVERVRSRGDARALTVMAPPPADSPMPPVVSIDPIHTSPLLHVFFVKLITRARSSLSPTTSTSTTVPLAPVFVTSKPRITAPFAPVT